MKTTIFFKIVTIFLILVIIASCNEENHNPSPLPADSRNIKYEITGNATGTFDTTIIAASGSGLNETPKSLPWSKEIIAQAGVNILSFNAIVIGATPGKTITAKLFVGGVVKNEQTEIVKSDGMAIIAGLIYVLRK